MSENIIFKNNVIDFIDDYDYFILDIWGVLHDGSNIYDGAIDSLKLLKEAGKKVYLLSNAPRRSQKAVQVLNNLGISSDLYEFILTSGEAVYLDLENNQNLDFKQYGRNYYYIGPDKDLDLLNGLKYNKVDNIKNADFALLTGFDDFNSVKDEKITDLKKCKKQNLPLICVNPDLIVIKQTGQEIFCAGIIAQQYEEMGGEVIYFGKPYHSIYETIFSLTKIKDKSKIIAIGDGISTDIKGAIQAGIDNALIAGGILSNKLSIQHGQFPKIDDLKKLYNEYQIYPDFILAKL